MVKIVPLERALEVLLFPRLLPGGSIFFVLSFLGGGFASRADGPQEGSVIDRLFQNTEGSSPERLLLVLLSGFMHHEDNGQLRRDLLDDGKGIGAVQAREVIVQEHEVELFGEEGPHRIGDIGMEVGGEALRLQEPGEILKNVVVVLDNNDPHRLSLPCCWSSKEGAKW